MSHPQGAGLETLLALSTVNSQQSTVITVSVVYFRRAVVVSKIYKQIKSIGGFYFVYTSRNCSFL
jgi:hypothetical protein